MSQRHFLIFMALGFTLALVQMAVGASKSENIKRAATKIKEAVSNGAKLVALPVRYLKVHVVKRLVFVSCFRFNFRNAVILRMGTNFFLNMLNLFPVEKLQMHFPKWRKKTKFT